MAIVFLGRKQYGNFKINSQMYQAGDVLVNFNLVTGIVKATHKFNTRSALFNEPWSNLRDDSGNPFDEIEGAYHYIEQNFFADAPAAGGAFSTSLTVATYAEMIGKATGSQPIIFFVQADETMDGAPMSYQYSPGPPPTLLQFVTTKIDL